MSIHNLCYHYGEKAKLSVNDCENTLLNWAFDSKQQPDNLQAGLLCCISYRFRNCQVHLQMLLSDKT